MASSRSGYNACAEPASVDQTDDTPIKVQDYEGQGVKTGRLRVYRGVCYTVYDYTPDRRATGRSEP
jgi:hypothetical protein